MEGKSGGSNRTLITVAVIGVAGIAGYLIYKAGKSTAAATANTALPPQYYPGTATPVSYYPGTNVQQPMPVQQPTNAAVPQQTQGTNWGQIATAGASVLNSVIGLFGNKKSTTTTAANNTASTGTNNYDVASNSDWGNSEFDNWEDPNYGWG